MKTLTEFLKHIKEFNDFEEFLEYYDIDIPSISDEKNFINNLSGRYSNHIYERLGESLSPSYLWTLLNDELSNYIDFNRNDIGIVQERDENIMLKIVIPISFEHNDKFRNKFNDILKSCNWSVESVRKVDKKNKAYFLEPNKPSNVSEKIYNEFGGILYRVLYQKNGHTEDKLKKILRVGLNPKQYILSYDDSEIYRTYFIANVNFEECSKDLSKLIKEVSDYDNNRNELKILKIDLNKLSANHSKTIEAFQDPRMNLICYWTSDFIPPSCIEDVTKDFKNILEN